MPEKRWLKRHRDDELFDEIRITTIPRYKTSGLSGDEWRTSALVEFFRKGEVLFKDQRLANLETAVSFLGYLWIKAGEELFGSNYDTLCCQPGCSEVAIVIYRLKKTYCNEGHESTPPFPTFRQFCKRHALRGECGLEDADNNYDLIEGEQPQGFRAEDESPAVFGGVIDLTKED